MTLSMGLPPGFFIVLIGGVLFFAIKKNELPKPLLVLVLP